MTSNRSFAGGLTSLGLGVALMYLFDPQQGRRRRHQLRDKALHAWHAERDLFAKAGRDLVNRSRGVAAVFQAQPDRGDSDRVIAERVRAQLGRTVTHPGSIEVQVHGGIVALFGPILADEVQPLIRRVLRVRGVKDVHSKLEIHLRDDREPGLQGAGRRPGRMHWLPLERVIAGSAGALLFTQGLGRRGRVLGLAETGVGAALLVRSVVNAPLARALGLTRGHAVDVQKTIKVAAPIEDVFGLWRQLELFPQFMQHVRKVTTTGAQGERSRWEIDGPAGVPLGFDAELVRVEANREIAWRTLPEQAIQHAGRVRFEDLGDRTTRVHVQLHFAPPAGALGHTVASLFGFDPKSRMDGDLVRMKALLEQGHTRAHGTRVSLGELRGSAQGPLDPPGR